MRSVSAVLAALIGFGTASLAPADSRASARQIWDLIKRSLQGPSGAIVFEENVKDSLIPPPPFRWTGTVVSSEPPDAPGKLVLGFGDSRAPEITLLLFERDWSPAKLKPVRPGTKVAFAGPVTSFRSDPYMLTFEIEIGSDAFFLLGEPTPSPKGK